MKVTSFTAIVDVLIQAQVRFIVVGGLAVSAHGYLCVTRDVDLVIELAPENIQKAFKALSRIGYQSSISVGVDDFADAEQRRTWIREKKMVVLKFWSDQHRETPLDVFLEHPFDFDAEWNKVHRESLYNPKTEEILSVPFVSLSTLISMKEHSDRDQDRIDVKQLRRLAEEMENP